MASQDELSDLKSKHIDAAESMLTSVLCRSDRFLELAAEYQFHTVNYTNALVDAIDTVSPEVAEALEMEARYCDSSVTYLLGTLMEIRRRRGMG
jgi:hypothetical protein